MRKFVFPLVIVFVIAAFAALPAAAITWGEPDTTHENVGAMVADMPESGPMQLCSGTLIHPRVFLTAGHCTDAIAAYGIETVWVNFDPYALTPGTLRLVEQVITHPAYGWGSADPHDVGLLVLAEPVTEITPAALPPLGYLDMLKKAGELRTGPAGAKFTVVGYGTSLIWPPPEMFSDFIRQVAVSEYIALNWPWLHLSQNIKKGDGGTCFGDSGGPAFYTAADGSEIVVALTSTGDPLCITKGLNYRVDIPDSLSFIYGVIATLE